MFSNPESQTISPLSVRFFAASYSKVSGFFEKYSECQQRIAYISQMFA